MFELFDVMNVGGISMFELFDVMNVGEYLCLNCLM